MFDKIISKNTEYIIFVSRILKCLIGMFIIIWNIYQKIKIVHFEIYIKIVHDDLIIITYHLQ